MDGSPGGRGYRAPYGANNKKKYGCIIVFFSGGSSGIWAAFVTFRTWKVGKVFDRVFLFSWKIVSGPQSWKIQCRNQFNVFLVQSSGNVIVKIGSVLVGSFSLIPSVLKSCQFCKFRTSVSACSVSKLVQGCRKWYIWPQYNSFSPSASSLDSSN